MFCGDFLCEPLEAGRRDLDLELRDDFLAPPPLLGREFLDGRRE